MVTKQAEKALEELMRDAVNVPEPGDQPGTVVQKPDATNPAAMVLDIPESAGWVQVWDRFSGEPSIVNRNMLMAQLQKRDDQGRLVFTTVPPSFAPTRGALKCILHRDSPDRAEYDRMGMPVCRKANLRTPLDVETHMKHRHQREWAAIEQKRQAEIEDEERQVRRALISQARRPEPAPATPPPAPKATVRSSVEEICPDCKGPIRAKKQRGMGAARWNHKQRCPARQKEAEAVGSG